MPPTLDVQPVKSLVESAETASGALLASVGVLDHSVKVLAYLDSVLSVQEPSFHRGPKLTIICFNGSLTVTVVSVSWEVIAPTLAALVQVLSPVVRLLNVLVKYTSTEPPDGIVPVALRLTQVAPSSVTT